MLNLLGLTCKLFGVIELYMETLTEEEKKAL
jgi:hypothetical protein